MPKKGATGYEDKLELYEKLVATDPRVTRKGDTMPYTSLNGHMFSYLTKTGELALRLPPATIDEFIEKYRTNRSAQYGIVQKEYAIVPDSLLAKTSELKKYFAISYAYVESLKPKPTTRPKKAAAKRVAPKTKKNKKKKG